MKILNFDLVQGTTRHVTNNLTEFLRRTGKVEIIQEPVDEHYFVIAVFHNWGFYNVAQPYNTKIVNDIKSNKASLILTAGWDSVGIIPTYGLKRSPNVLVLIREAAKLFDIDPKKILYIDCNFKIDKVLERHNLNGMWLNLWECNYKALDTENIVNDIVNKNIRSKKFLYFGGKPREHRLKFLNELLKLNNFEQDSFVSNGPGSVNDFVTKKSIFVEGRILDIEEVLLKDGMNDIDAEAVNPYYHINSYINIIPNSYFYANHTRIEVNEKVFKPIMCMQPFILLGEPNTLSILHNLGYKTFNTWFDESYDKTLDDNERLSKIVKVIESLNKLSYVELSDILLDMLPTLTHNVSLQKQRQDELLNELDLYHKIHKFFDQLS